MHPRQLTARIVQRTSKALVVAALALGLSASVLAPSAAFAAPLNPRPGPSFSPDLVPVADRPNVLPDGTIAIVAGVKNQGSRGATPVLMRFQFPSDVYDIKVNFPGDFNCFVSGYVVMCSSDMTLDGGETRGVNVTARTANPGTYNIDFTVDPNGHVAESRETNNRTTFSAVVQ
jgi:hypothetical protein